MLDVFSLEMRGGEELECANEGYESSLERSRENEGLNKVEVGDIEKVSEGKI